MDREQLNGELKRAVDEELVCIAENNSCSLDAVQELLGCTFGKGNLIYRDNGKQVFTIYSRGDGKAIRLYFKADLPRRPERLSPQEDNFSACGKRPPEGRRLVSWEYVLQWPGKGCARSTALRQSPR